MTDSTYTLNVVRQGKWRLGIVLCILFCAFAVLIPATAQAATVSGEGYSFDTDTGRLTILTEAGSTA